MGKTELPPGLTPPASLEAEQALIGSALLRPSGLDEWYEMVWLEDFYSDKNKTVFTAISELYRANQPIDVVSVAEILKNQGKLDVCGGYVYLAQLAEHVGTAANAPYYARLVRQKAMLRQLLETSQTITQGCLGYQDDPEGFVAQAEELVCAIREQRLPSHAYRLGDLAPVEVTRLERIYETRTSVLGVPSGFVDLDKLTAGFQPGDLILLAARPSMGKTALALNMAFYAASQGMPTLFFSLEQPKEQLAQRQMAASGNVNAWRLRSGHLGNEDWGRVMAAAGEMQDVPLWIVDTPALTLLDLRAQARRLRCKEGIGLILVDYLQLIRDPKAKSREQEVGGISRGLKALAKEMTVPVIALSQLNREVEKRPNKRPMLSDLRESGSLEQDADMVLFLYREAAYRDEADNVAELRVAKQRNGPCGLVKLAFLREVMRFENYQENP